MLIEGFGLFAKGVVLVVELIPRSISLDVSDIVTHIDVSVVNGQCEQIKIRVSQIF